MTLFILAQLSLAHPFSSPVGFRGPGAVEVISSVFFFPPKRLTEWRTRRCMLPSGGFDSLCPPLQGMNYLSATRLCARSRLLPVRLHCVRRAQGSSRPPLPSVSRTTAQHSELSPGTHFQRSKFRGQLYSLWL